MDIWFSQMDTENVKTSIRVDKQLFSATSEYQRIDVFQSKEFGKMIVLDGEIIFSEADEFIYNEMVVHVPMACLLYTSCRRTRFWKLCLT